MAVGTRFVQMRMYVMQNSILYSPPSLFCIQTVKGWENQQQVVGWRRQSTFAVFYNKTVISGRKFTYTVLF